ncbi:MULTISPECIES: hypothetical protein [unclassified Rufibacter]|uniref:hypothetical protein n=1 Tax=unclassified Rufibacter TaxID=2639626 RepID=UPI0015E72CE1|nr:MULTISPECIES: hypothetical protein [unclassified Rufibacter]
MQRTIKISSQADENLDALKLLISRRIKKKVTKGQVVSWSLKMLSDKLKTTQEGESDGEA